MPCNPEMASWMTLWSKGLLYLNVCCAHGLTWIDILHGGIHCTSPLLTPRPGYLLQALPADTVTAHEHGIFTNFDRSG